MPLGPLYRVLAAVSERGPDDVAWLERLYDDPLAMLTGLLAIATVFLGVGAMMQVRAAHRARVDSASPRVALSVGNVLWPPKGVSWRALMDDGIDKASWVPVMTGRTIPEQVRTHYWGAHTVGRIRSDGGSTAYLSINVVNGDLFPMWSYSGVDDMRSPMFRVSTREVTLAPSEQVELDLFPGFSAERWADDPITIRWAVEVTSRLPEETVDTCEIVWQLTGHVDLAARTVQEAGSGTATVTRWRRRYGPSWWRRWFRRGQTQRDLRG